MLSYDQKQVFAREGFLVLPAIAPPESISRARKAVNDRLRLDPPPADYRGPFSYFIPEPLPDPLGDLLFDTPALAAARSLITPGEFEAPDHVQVALTMPPWSHRPGGPHIDGLNPAEPDGLPGTFTLLAGLMLTDQVVEFSGNLWVWPGSHLLTAAFLREQGPDALLSGATYPPIDLPTPRQVRGHAGDLLLAHYLLGHNAGGNMTAVTRETVYFRLRRQGHRERWREVVQDPLLEFEPVQSSVPARIR
jgi:hypothetical protein